MIITKWQCRNGCVGGRDQTQLNIMRRTTKTTGLQLGPHYSRLTFCCRDEETNPRDYTARMGHEYVVPCERRTGVVGVGRFRRDWARNALAVGGRRAKSAAARHVAEDGLAGFPGTCSETRRASNCGCCRSEARLLITPCYH